MAQTFGLFYDKLDTLAIEFATLLRREISGNRFVTCRSKRITS